MANGGCLPTNDKQVGVQKPNQTREEGEALEQLTLTRPQGPDHGVVFHVVFNVVVLVDQRQLGDRKTLANENSNATRRRARLIDHAS